MVNRFVVKFDSVIKEFKTLEEACKKIKALEKLDYDCSLWIKTMGLYSEHLQLIYVTALKEQLKQSVSVINELF